MLLLLLSAPIVVSAQEDLASCEVFTRPGVARLGVRGDLVLQIQKTLNKDKDTRVTSVGAGAPGFETKVYGAKTLLAVKKFQEKYRDEILTPSGLIKATGQVGSATKRKLYSVCNPYASSTTNGTQGLISTSSVTQNSLGAKKTIGATSSSLVSSSGASASPKVIPPDSPYIASPKDGELYRQQYSISVVVAAPEASSKVLLFVDGKSSKLQTITSTSQRVFVFKLEARDFAFGKHVLTAQITNTKGKVKTTPPVEIEVVRLVTGGSSGSALPVKTDGVCGVLHGGELSTPLPSDGFCQTGMLGGVTGTGPWSWTCAGDNGGSVASCSATAPLPESPQSPQAGLSPSCGSSHGLPYITKPAFDLCSGGEASAVSGQGPYTWNCSSTGHSTVSCQSPAIVPTGVTYYLADCQAGAAPACVSGTSTNSGTNSASPKRVFAELPSLQKGDSVLFAEGGSWINASMRFRNTPATRVDPIVFDSYSTPWGGGQRPLLTESRSGFHVFNFDDAGVLDAAGTPFNDGGYVIRNLSLRGGATFQNHTGGGGGVFISRRVHDVVIENMDIAGFGSAVFATHADNTYVTVRDSNFHDNISFGWLGGADHLVIENTVFDRNGSMPIYDHNLYLSYLNHAIVRGNTFTRNTLDTNGRCVATVIVVHGTTTNLLIENNYLEEVNASPGCYGIEISPGYGVNSGMESFANNTIRNNTVVNVGFVGIGARNCFECVIENNNIVWTKNTGMFGFSMGVNTPGAEDDQRSKIIIRNNSVYTNSSIMTAGIAMLPLGGEHVVTSNMMYFGSGTAGSVKCFDLGTSTRSFYTEFDNNACYRVGGSPLYSNLNSTFASASMALFDVHGSEANPLLSLIPHASSSYLIQTSSLSPLVNAGHLVYSSVKDLFNNLRGSMPDIGATEFISQ